MRGHNICFHEELTKIILYSLLSRALYYIWNIFIFRLFSIELWMNCQLLNTLAVVNLGKGTTCDIYLRVNGLCDPIIAP